MLSMPKVESPCIRNCCLNDDDICMGCFRTLDEIKAWLSLTDREKFEVLRKCQERKTESNR